MSKKLFTDDNARKIFRTDLEGTVDRINKMIVAFNTHQQFTKITTQDVLESYLMGPTGYYDLVVLRNIDLPQKRGLEINIDKLCELYSIDRPGFLSALGVEHEEEDCPSCHKGKVRVKGSFIPVNYVTYSQYKKFLSFDGVLVGINEDAVKKEMERFDIHTSSKKQDEAIDHIDNLFSILEKHYKSGFVGPAKMQEICRALDDIFKVVDNVLYKNDQVITSMIIRL